MAVYSAARWDDAMGDAMAVRSVDLLDASMDAHWVAAMVGLTGANWAVCSADMMAAS